MKKIRTVSHILSSNGISDYEKVQSLALYIPSSSALTKWSSSSPEYVLHAHACAYSSSLSFKNDKGISIEHFGTTRNNGIRIWRRV